MLRIQLQKRLNLSGIARYLAAGSGLNLQLQFVYLSVFPAAFSFFLILSL